jgi:hypothetical protein
MGRCVVTNRSGPTSEGKSARAVVPAIVAFNGIIACGPQYRSDTSLVSNLLPPRLSVMENFQRGHSSVPTLPGYFK